LAASIVFPHRNIILDACCVINLHASGRLDEIVASLHASVTIASYVYEQELSKTVVEPDAADRQTEQGINLHSALALRIITLASLESEAEETAFVNLAVYLDDGEAITGAIASVRGWTVATDDRTAISFLRRQAPSVQIVSTLELVKHWVDARQPSPDVIRAVLERIRVQAKYKPGRQHPLYVWWQQFLGETGDS
jgi:hypothetical protein